MNNPYKSPTTSQSSSNRLHAALLTMYAQYRGRDMPSGELIAKHFKGWVIAGFVTIVVVCVFIWIYGTGDAQNPVATAGLCGLMFGVFIGRIQAEIRMCRLTSRVWPLLNNILDWEKVSQRAEELDA